jgi:GNAT superfamily N-acetyltransferase
MEDAGELCHLQAFPAGPSRGLVEKEFLPVEEIKDKTLKVCCMMTGSPFQEENPYQRKGIGTKMVHELMRWAKEKGWQSIEATANEDLDILYANTGDAGKRFWEKLGFQLVKTETEPRFTGDFLKTMQEQAKAQNLPPERVKNKYTMKIQLT